MKHISQILLLSSPILLLVCVAFFATKTTPRMHTPILQLACNGLRIGMPVEDAWKALGSPREEVNYDYGEFLEARYKEGKTHLRIMYKSTGEVTEISLSKRGKWIDLQATGECS